MNDKYLEIIKKSKNPKIDKFSSGDLVNINIWIKEGNKKRIQKFKGYVISIKKKGINSSFTIRKISYGIGIERIFQNNSPIIESINIEKKSSVKKSKLYYIRNRYGKSAKIKEKI